MGNSHISPFSAAPVCYALMLSAKVGSLGMRSGIGALDQGFLYIGITL